jgi:hypothetical protein
MTDTTDLDPIEPLGDINTAPPVHSNEQLRRRWRSLLGPESFGRDTLWVVWFDADGFQSPVIVPIDDIPARLDHETLDGLITVLDRPADLGAASVALALSRPGPATVSDVDRHRAVMLQTTVHRTRADGRLRLNFWPIHLATHNCVRTLGPDDLASGLGAPGSS